MQKNSPNFSQHQKRVSGIFFCKEYYRWWGAWSYLLKKVLHSEVECWKSWRMFQLWFLSLFLLENLFIILVWCRLLFLQWKSILIKTSQKRRRNIIYTFIVCLFLFQKWSNPHHSPLLKSRTKIIFPFLLRTCPIVVVPFSMLMKLLLLKLNLYIWKTYNMDI